MRIKNKLVGYLILSSAIATAYILVYNFILTSMPFIKNSSIFDKCLNGAAVCLIFALISLGFIYVNVALAAVYVIYRSAKVIRQRRENQNRL